VPGGDRAFRRRRIVVPAWYADYRWWVVGMLWLVCVFNYADRQAIFSVFPLLRTEMGLSDIQLGFVGSAFMWVYAAVLPLAGVVGDDCRLSQPADAVAGNGPPPVGRLRRHHRGRHLRRADGTTLRLAVRLLRLRRAGRRAGRRPGPAAQGAEARPGGRTGRGV